MSMFHELMMRKKEEIMYATIKGTLTENDGVFSGFSVGSCLLTQQEIGNKPFELVAKINLTTMVYLSPIFVGSGNPALTVHIESSKLKMQIGNGTSWVSSILTGVTTISANTDYYVKLVFDGIKFIGYLSSDGTNWNKEVEWVNTISVLPTYYLKIGNDRSSSTYYLSGSIDLNRSYIKNGSTKYNLQAVVGYTIVGSPTITDGVVSGFSGNDYLNILSPKSVPTEIQSNNMKIKMKIKTPQQWLSSNMFIIGYNHSVSSDSATLYDGGLYITASGELTIHTAIIDNSQPYIKLELDTIYYIEIETKGVFKIGISQDNVNWTHTQKDIYRDKWYLRNRNIRIGRALTGYAQEFNGEIFINETSFIINNKLWFNGQQA